MTYQQKALLEFLAALGEKGTASISRDKQATMDNLVRNAWAVAMDLAGFKVYVITQAGKVALQRHADETKKRADIAKATSSAARASA